MAIKIVIVLGVVVVLLFIGSVILNARNGNDIDKSGTDAQTADIQQRFGSLLATPLQGQDVGSLRVGASNCPLTQPGGCRMSSPSSGSAQVLSSDDRIRQVRRATFALLPTSSPGATLTATFKPLRDDPANGLVQSRSTPVPTPTPPPGQQAERGRVQLNVSREGGTLAFACGGPPNAVCQVGLVAD